MNTLTKADHPSAARPIRRFDLLAAACLVILVWAVFGQTAFFDFVAWDDNELIYENPHFGGLTWDRIVWMFTDLKYLWRYLPLSWLGWSLNYEIGGLNPAGYHIGNVLLHTANTILVFLTVRMILAWRYAAATSEVQPDEFRRKSVFAAAFAASLWAVHPLRAEPVAWITDRVYCQALTFLLLAFWCYLKWRTMGENNRLLYWSGVALFAASLLSYQTGLCYGAVLIVLDFWPARRFAEGWHGLLDRRGLRIWAEKIPYGILAVGVAVLALGAKYVAEHGGKPEAGDGFGAIEHVTQAFYVWWYFLWKPFAPAHLSPYYDTLLTVDVWQPRFFFSAILVLATTVLLWNNRRCWPGLLAVWVCHLALLLPVAGLTEHPHYPSDRYNYFAAICWCIPAAALVFRAQAHKAWGQWSCAAATILVLCLAVMTSRQAGVWRNSATLMEHIVTTLDSKPTPPGVHWRLAHARARSGDTDLALGSFRQYATTFGGPENAFYQAAHVLSEAGLTAEAERLYATLIAKRADDARFRTGYGFALIAAGRHDDAIAQFVEATKLEPGKPGPWHNIGVTLLRQGKTNEARPYLERARDLQGR